MSLTKTTMINIQDKYNSKDQYLKSKMEIKEGMKKYRLVTLAILSKKPEGRLNTRLKIHKRGVNLF